MRRGRRRGRGAVLEIAQDAEEQSLSGRGEQVNAVKIGEAGEGGGVGVSDEPLAGVAALEAGAGERGAAEDESGEGVFADAGFALDGGDLEVGGGHLSLHEELAPSGADADDGDKLGRLGLDEREREGGRLGLEVAGALHGSQRASPPRPAADLPGQQWLHRRGGEKHEPQERDPAEEVLTFSAVRVTIRGFGGVCCCGAGAG